MTIGNYVSIASGVKFLLGGNHSYDTFSTYPLITKPSLSKGEIIVQDDVWIGTDALILSGIKLGKGAVIAAISVVTKDVPPYAIVGGNPAKILKYRFNENIIKELVEYDFDEIDKDFIEKNMHLLDKSLDIDVLRKILRE